MYYDLVPAEKGTYKLFKEVLNSPDFKMFFPKCSNHSDQQAKEYRLAEFSHGILVPSPHLKPLIHEFEKLLRTSNETSAKYLHKLIY